MNRCLKLFSFVLFLGLLGCATTEGKLSLSIPESSFPYDRAWQAALEGARNYYPRVAIEDKETGFFQTAWNERKDGLLLGAPVKRTRLIGRVTNRAPFRLQLTLEEEAFSMEQGRWLPEPPDEKFLKEIAQNMRQRL
jgi:hypothetical protein